MVKLSRSIRKNGKKVNKSTRIIRLWTRRIKRLTIAAAAKAEKIACGKDVREF